MAAGNSSDFHDITSKNVQFVQRARLLLTMEVSVAMSRYINVNVMKCKESKLSFMEEAEISFETR